MMAPFRSTLSACALLLGAAPALAQGAVPRVAGVDLAPGAAAANLAATIPGLSANVQGIGVPGLDSATSPSGMSHFFFWNSPSSFDGQETVRIDRHMNSGSGIAGGYVYKGLSVLSTNNPGDQGFEWAIVGEMDSTANIATGAQNVAINATLRKLIPSNRPATTGASGTGTVATVTYNGSTPIPVDDAVLVAGVTPSGYNGTYLVAASSCASGVCQVSYANATTGAQTAAGTIVDVSGTAGWAFNANAMDFTGESDPRAALLAGELDVNPVGGGTDIHRQRVGLQIVGQGLGAHIGRGLLMNTDGSAIIDRAMEFDNSYGIGLDFTAATFSAAPILMASGQAIAFDGVSTGMSFSHSLFWTAGAFYFKTQNGNVVSIDDLGGISSNGNIAATGTLSAGGSATIGGTLNAGGYYVAGVQGVTCTLGALNLSTAVVTDGILTHC